MKIRYEVICFQRNGADWFSVKDLTTGDTQVYSWDEWLAIAPDLAREGIRHGQIQGPKKKED